MMQPSLFDSTTTGLIAPSDDVLELRDRLRSVECLVRVVEAAKEKLRQQIQFEIGDTQGFDMSDHGGGKMMFKFDSRGRVNHSAVADELAKLGREYREKNVAIVGINSNDAEHYPDDSPAAMRDEVDRRGSRPPGRED